MGVKFEDLKQKYKNILMNKTWYHGTTLSQLENLENGVKALHNANKELDFGPGFYLAPDLEMAKRYIEMMVGYQKEIAEIYGFNDEELTPIVIEYEFDFPVSYYFTNTDYKTSCFPKYNEDFAEFVFTNRTKLGELQHDYDLVYGVMSDSNPADLILNYKAGNISKDEIIESIVQAKRSTKQLSIHNQSICDTLVIKERYRIDKEGVVKIGKHGIGKE